MSTTAQVGDEPSVRAVDDPQSNADESKSNGSRPQISGSPGGAPSAAPHGLDATENGAGTASFAQDQLLSQLVRELRENLSGPVDFEPHFTQAKVLLQEVQAAIRRNPELATDPELATWIGFLPHLDASPIDVSGPTAIVIESLIGEGRPKVGDNALAEKLEQQVRQKLGLRSPAVFVVLGLGGLLYLLIPLFFFASVAWVRPAKSILGLPTDILVLVAIAGAVGSIVSLLSRVPEFAKQRKADRFVLIMTGLSKPLIGTSFALFIYVLFESQLIPIELPDDVTSAYYAAIGFVAGFSERLVPDLVGRTERQFGGNGSPTT